jgi:hypothetical protein
MTSKTVFLLEQDFYIAAILSSILFTEEVQSFFQLPHKMSKELAKQAVVEAKGHAGITLKM